ncbi:hypothetical protein [Butyrivibrio sp. WCD3002]|uniref:hypothetical protein n=1 Tax=Butyrivibrio sp. WCD3002 TaxID=1280676 RepID=UPI00041AA1DA|nr:hypothetical protein [Butyrivibrio sp. WCD3002]
MNTNLSQLIDISNESARYDEYVKEIFADKQILARILKYTLDEFSDVDIETIINNIDEPEVSRIRMEPGYTNNEKIKKLSEEDNIPFEGKVVFDIRFSVYCGEESIKILINIEAQKTTNASKLGYHLDNRIIYYLGRMISSQKEVEFSKSDYDNLKAVRSIWICMDAGDEEDSINRISFRQETLYGKEMTLSNIDKVQGVIIRLRSNEEADKSKNLLIAMLEELLRKEDIKKKKRKLSEEYGLKINTNTERRLEEMCNLSQVLVDKGIEQGIEIGEITGKVCARYEDGMSIAEIAEKSNVSIEVVENILKEKGLL